MKNAADPQQVQDAAIHERFGRDRELDDFKFIMESVQGRRFMARMFDICGFQKTSMSSSGSTTFYNEGMRSVALILWRDMNEVCPELYLTMLRECRQREEKDNG